MEWKGQPGILPWLLFISIQYLWLSTFHILLFFEISHQQSSCIYPHYRTFSFSLKTAFFLRLDFNLDKIQCIDVTKTDAKNKMYTPKYKLTIHTHIHTEMNSIPANWWRHSVNDDSSIWWILQFIGGISKKILSIWKIGSVCILHDMAGPVEYFSVMFIKIEKLKIESQ